MDKIGNYSFLDQNKSICDRFGMETFSFRETRFQILTEFKSLKFFKNPNNKIDFKYIMI